jgi:glycosyltransferase involved in cell wall biosynthesis
MATSNHETGAPRVLIVPPSYLAGERTIGGGERFALEYARALARLVPTTLALFGREPALDRVGDLTVRTFPLKADDRRFSFPLTAEAWREIGEYDVIHSMIFPSPATDWLTLNARRRGQRVVLTDMGGGLPCISTYLQRLHPRADLSRLADGLAPLSQYAAGFFGNWPHEQTVLYGGVNLDEFPVTPVPTEGYALFVGRLLPHKGVLQLIEAMPPRLPLHVVGRPYDPAFSSTPTTASCGDSSRGRAWCCSPPSRRGAGTRWTSRSCSVSWRWKGWLPGAR